MSATESLPFAEVDAWIRDTLTRDPLVECAPIVRPCSAAFFEAATRRLAPAVALNLLSPPVLQRTEGGDFELWTRAGGDPTTSRVGLAQLSLDDGDHTLRVRPKVEGAAWLALLRLARGWGDWQLDPAQRPLVGRPDDIIEILLAAYLDSLERLREAGGVRRWYDTRDEVLRCRIRGRLQVRRYVAFRAMGRADQVPCHHTVHDTDHPYARVLLHALRICGALASTVDATGGLARKSAALEMLFAGVSDDPSLNASSVSPPPGLPRALSAYEATGAWPLACMLIRVVSPVYGTGAERTVGISLSMPGLYEDALREALGGAQEQWTYRTGSGLEKILAPDIVIEGGAADRDVIVVADAKWKRVYDSEDETERIVERDVYQVLAYLAWARQHHREKRVVGVLVYPARRDSRVEAVHFGPVGRHDPVCWLAGWPLDETYGAAELRARAVELINEVVARDARPPI